MSIVCIKNLGPGLYNSLHHTDNGRYFLGLSLTQNRREAHMFFLAREVGKFGCVLLEKKGNFIVINEFKYGQTWKIWPSLYSTLKFALIQSLLGMPVAWLSLIFICATCLFQSRCSSIKTLFLRHLTEWVGTIQVFYHLIWIWSCGLFSVFLV